MQPVIKYFLVFLLFGALVLVRMFAEELFYDPLISFFKSDYHTEPLPDVNLWKLLANVSFRFWINAVISLAILWILFKKKSILQFSGWLFLMVFLGLSIAFSILLHTSETGQHLVLFYVRRFLIQPILILLLIPAFYFQKRIQ